VFLHRKAQPTTPAKVIF